MSWYMVLQTVLVLGLLALVGFVIAVLIQLRRTLVSVDELAKNVNTELVPLLSKAQIALDEVNSELARVDGIVTSFQEVSDRVQTGTDVAKKLISTPAVKLVGFVSGARVAIASLVNRRHKK